MINKSKDSAQESTSITISLASSVVSGLLSIIIGFGAWYLWLRPDDEFFPFPNSRIEVLWVVVLFAIIGFWLGPKVNNLISGSRYQSTVLYIFSGLLLFGSGIGVGYIIWGNQTAQEAADAEEITIPENITRYDVSIDDDPIYGSANAKITIIQFADYECPYCTKWQLEVWPEIQKEFPNEVRLVYRDFPLYGMHANAESAAEAANCAREQNAYWEYHEALFAAEHGLSAEAFVQYATDLKLDAEKFSECMESNRFVDEVKADYQYATNLGVNSAPTFFINGIPIIGAQPFSVFKQIITKELAGEIPQ